MLNITKVQEGVRQYYGKTLESRHQLKTGTCCSVDGLPQNLRQHLALIDDEIKDKFYGCGSPIPPALDGCTVLDLGCGTGRDTYLVSALVGSQGRVIGVDMTAEQLEIANRHLDAQMRRFGYDKPNVEFHQGLIEQLDQIGIEDDSIDVVISNCVINLAPDKRPVFEQIFRVLKPGGELYFSDIFADRRVPKVLSADPMLRGECLGGALYIEDFRRMLRKVGCLDYRAISRSAVPLQDGEVEAKVGMIAFTSLTIRAFKINTLEDQCEDYGQVACYLGTIPECPHYFDLDDHHRFATGKPKAVCGNTASMLVETRFAPYFKVTSDRSTHFGSFDCASGLTTDSANPSSGQICC